MQMNETVVRIRQARRAKPETRAKRPDAGASRPVVTPPPEIAFEPKRYPRRYGAGY